MSHNCAHHAGLEARRGSKTNMGPTLPTHAWRLQLMRNFKHVGNFTKVARQHGTSASVVCKWVRTYEGTGDVSDKASSGRHVRGLAGPPVREVLKARIRDGKTCTAILSDLKVGFNGTVRGQ
jgi:transposase-like protein